MTDDEKKLVTEWLGERICNQDAIRNDGRENGFCYNDRTRICDYCEYHTVDNSRTFTTPDDWFACWERLVSTKQLHLFYARSRHLWWDNYRIGDQDYPIYEEWLHSHTESGEFVLCKLIAEARKEGVL